MKPGICSILIFAFTIALPAARAEDSAELKKAKQDLKAARSELAEAFENAECYELIRRAEHMEQEVDNGIDGFEQKCQLEIAKCKANSSWYPGNSETKCMAEKATPVCQQRDHKRHEAKIVRGKAEECRGLSTDDAINQRGLKIKERAQAVADLEKTVAELSKEEPPKAPPPKPAFVPAQNCPTLAGASPAAIAASKEAGAYSQRAAAVNKGAKDPEGKSSGELYALAKQKYAEANAEIKKSRKYAGTCEQGTSDASSKAVHAGIGSRVKAPPAGSGQEAD